MTLSKLVSRQRLIAVLLLTALLLLSGLGLLKAKAVSYAKVEPYTIELSVIANAGSTVFLSYDYGYGIRDEHIRPLRIEPDESIDAESTEFILSVSAWKPVHALYFISPKDNHYTLTHVQIRKNGVSIAPTLPAGGPTLEGDNWIYRLPLTDVDNKHD